MNKKKQESTLWRPILMSVLLVAIAAGLIITFTNSNLGSNQATSGLQPGVGGGPGNIDIGSTSPATFPPTPILNPY